MSNHTITVRSTEVGTNGELLDADGRRRGEVEPFDVDAPPATLSDRDTAPALTRTQPAPRRYRAERRRLARSGAAGRRGRPR